MIEVRNIVKSFEGRKVLKDISTVFEKGKTNLIIGQSGSGKTVLLKSIVGLLDIDEGEIFLDGINVGGLNFSEIKLLRQDIGMVFQGGALFDSLKVEENVQFPLDMFTKKTVKEKKKRVDMCLERVNLTDANTLYPSEISGGMRKRVAIARAIVLNPKYLFCDEPNSGLDPVTSIVIDNLIKEITTDLNITTIVNTHDMNSVMEIGDNILFIAEGEKCWVGSKDEVLNTDNKKLNAFIFASPLYKEIRQAKNQSPET